MVSKKLHNQVVPRQCSFKENTKKKLTESRSTIENEHDKKLKQFKENDILKWNISLLDYEIKSLYDDEITHFYSIKNLLDKKLSRENDEMVQYLLNLGKFLMDTNANFQDSTNENSTSSNIPTNIYSFSDNHIQRTFENVTDIVKLTNTNNRGERYRKFMDNVIGNVNTIEENNEESFCRYCNVPLDLDTAESTLICPKCGISFTYIDTTGMTYNMFTDTTIEPVTFYEYKRINHLNDWIMSLQGEESVVISNEIILLINDEIRKMRIDKAKLKPAQVKMILKKLKLNKYYEHTHSIICRITNRKPVQLSSELQEKIKKMFLQAERTFLEMENKSRRNFLSYSYLLKKIVELLGEVELAKHFTLLKSRSKLQSQEAIWKDICTRNNWNFIPSL